MQTKAYAAHGATEPLKPFDIERRALGSDDVHIDILYCGVCHTDIHIAHNDWKATVYPVVPGHEIVGRVVACGDNATQFKIGELVGVGCIVSSCRNCSACKEDLEQYCEQGMVMTYNSPDAVSGGVTYGGYADKIIVDKNFVLHVSEKLDAKAVAPLLCAGITCYSPLRQWNIKANDKVGVIGLGGLGHLGIKLAAAMGAHVVMITTSEDKAKDAKALGAQDVLISTDKADIKNHSNSFDFLLNTIPVAHNINPYISLMKRDTTMVIVGAITPLPDVHAGSLMRKRKRIAGSLIGGIKETQEMLDLCAEHNIVSDIEMINIQDVNQAWARVMRSDVKYRFVIDMQSLKG